MEIQSYMVKQLRRTCFGTKPELGAGLALVFPWTIDLDAQHQDVVALRIRSSGTVFVDV